MALAAALLGTAPARGCSMVEGYKVPTNLELAAKAEAIVVAEIVADIPGRNDPGGGSLRLRPLSLLKGTVMPVEVILTRARLTVDPRFVVASNPRELRRPNPGALIGGCVRYMFGTGMKLVLFLVRNEKGELSPFRSAFSRDAEDVPDLDALWVKAVREYAAIGVLPKSGWKGALKARIALLRSHPADSDAAAIADDMAIELKGKRLPPFD